MARKYDAECQATPNNWRFCWHAGVTECAMTIFGYNRIIVVTYFALLSLLLPSLSCLPLFARYYYAFSLYFSFLLFFHFLMISVIFVFKTEQGERLQKS